MWKFSTLGALLCWLSISVGNVPPSSRRQFCWMYTSGVLPSWGILPTVIPLFLPTCRQFAETEDLHFPLSKCSDGPLHHFYWKTGNKFKKLSLSMMETQPRGPEDFKKHAAWFSSWLKQIVFWLQLFTFIKQNCAMGTGHQLLLIYKAEVYSE